MGDKDGVEKLCETMQRMLSQLIEQTQTKTSASSEALKTLEPNPVKLTGPGDFFSWSRNALLILESHGLEICLKEDEKKPGDISQEQWEQSKKRVMVWLLGSMERSVREQVEIFQTAAEVWINIEKQFSGKSNKMQVCRIFHEMRHIRQEQKTVTEYAGEIKKLFRDLEFFRPFKAHDPRDIPLLREWFEPLLIQAFLEGLNPEFHLRSQLILATSDWPTLDQTIASILEEETRLSNQTTIPNMADTRATLSSLTHPRPHLPAVTKFDHANIMKPGFQRKNRVICDHCGKPGHLKRKCFELVGYPPGWQRRQPNRPLNQVNCEKNTEHGHFSTTTGERPTAVTARAVEEFKAKLMSTAEVPEATSSANISQGVNDLLTSWIIDSGATNHMTGSSKCFSSYAPRSGKDRVRIADGSSAPIMGCGNISC